MPTDPSVKCPQLYKALKRDGYSKSDAAAISNGLGRKGKCTEGRKEKGMFTVTKDAKTGEYRWTLISSSAYVDRDGEIVTEEALEKAVKRMDETGDYGELRWWHTPIVLGKADFAAVYAHQLIESGTFVSKEVGEKTAAAGNRLGASIGFKHPPTEPKAKAYHDIAIKERSLLPRGKESNLFTRLSVRGGDMTVKDLSAEKRAGLVSLLGEDEASRVLAAAFTTAKEADDLGVTRKEKGLLARFADWLKGQEDDFAEAYIATSKEADPKAEEEDDADLEELAEDIEAEAAALAEKKEAKAGDDTPVTMAQVKALFAEWEAKMSGDRKKETDGFATKAEVEAVAGVITPLAETSVDVVKRLGTVEKEVQTLVGENVPRGVAGVFRASQSDKTVTEKAEQQAEKFKQVNDPLDAWLDTKLSA